MVDAATTDFDGGGSVSATVDTANTHVDLTMDDPYYTTLGYFCVRLDGAAGESVSFDITNRTESRMPSTHHLVYATDMHAASWDRMDEPVDGGWTQTFPADSAFDSVFVADAWPYPYQKTVELVNQRESAYPDAVEVEVIGQSAEGRDMHALRVSDPDASASITASEQQHVISVARQHPGEVFGAWHQEAMLDAVIEGYAADGEFASELPEEFVWHFLPNANPDGLFRGHHRHDSVGTDQNRAWADAGPVEIDNMRAYLSSAIGGGSGDVFWGFDHHTSTSVSGYTAMFYETAVADLVAVDAIEEMASYNLSYTDATTGTDYTDRGRSFIKDEFGAVMVTTESSQYYPYTHAEIEQEALDYLSVMLSIDRRPQLLSTTTAVSGTPTLLSHNGTLVRLDRPLTDGSGQ